MAHLDNRCILPAQFVFVDGYVFLACLQRGVFALYQTEKGVDQCSTTPAGFFYQTSKK